MKKIILLVLALLPMLTLLAQVDSSAVQGNTVVFDDGDFSPGLFAITLIFLLGLLIAVIACFALAAVLALFIFLLTVAGILSFSVFMAWYRRSIYSGIKWFIYLSFSFAGMAGTAIVCLLAEEFGNASYSLRTTLSWGIPIGLAGGLLSGWVLLAISHALLRPFSAKDVG